MVYMFAAQLCISTTFMQYHVMFSWYLKELYNFGANEKISAIFMNSMTLFKEYKLSFNIFLK